MRLKSDGTSLKVIALSEQGKSSQEMADHLGITKSQVIHKIESIGRRKKIMRKNGVSDDELMLIISESEGDYNFMASRLNVNVRSIPGFIDIVSGAQELMDSLSGNKKGKFGGKYKAPKPVDNRIRCDEDTIYVERRPIEMAINKLRRERRFKLHPLYGNMVDNVPATIRDIIKAAGLDDSRFYM